MLSERRWHRARGQAGRLDALVGGRRGRRWLVDPPQPLGFRARLGAFARGRPTIRLRRLIAYGLLPPSAIPSRIRRALDLDGGRVQPLRIEVGGGPFPLPGYLHVDADASSRHLEHLAPAGRLPFGNGVAEEIVAIHVLEHLPPSDVVPTLREWRRVLRPGGGLRIHVPDGRAIATAFLNGDSELKWAAASAIYGAPADPGVRRSYDGGSRPRWSEHHALYDLELLTEVLQEGGFEAVADLSSELTDRHTEGWSHLIPGLSLIVGARRSG